MPLRAESYVQMIVYLVVGRSNRPGSIILNFAVANNIFLQLILMICCVLCLCCCCCTANAQIAKIYIRGVLLLLYICCCCIDEYWKFILIGIITRTRWDANAIRQWQYSSNQCIGTTRVCLTFAQQSSCASKALLWPTTTTILTASFRLVVHIQNHNND